MRASSCPAAACVRVGATLAALVVLSFSSAAFADAYDAALMRAVAAKERALDTRVPGDWELALDLFQQAEAIRSSPETCYEAGFAAEMLRQDDLALASYQAALAGGLSGSARERAQAFVNRHAREMGRVELKGSAGTRVRVRGLYRGTLPLPRPLVVFAGAVELELEAADGRRWVQALTVSAGATTAVDLGSAPEPLPPPSEPTRPAPMPAKVTEPGTSPRANAGPKAQANAATARPVAALERAAGAEPEPPSLVVAWTLLGVGAGVALGSAVLVARAPTAIDNHRATLKPLCAAWDGPDVCVTAKEENLVGASQDENNAIETWKNVRLGAIVGLGAGGAALLTGAVLLLASPTADAQAGSVFVSPMAGGSVVGWSRAF